MSEIIEQTITGMNERLNGEGLSKSIGLEIKGEGRILVDDTGARESTDDAACNITMSEKTFKGLLSGDVNPMTAVMLGKIKVKGDMSAAMSLSKLLG